MRCDRFFCHCITFFYHHRERMNALYTYAPRRAHTHTLETTNKFDTSSINDLNIEIKYCCVCTVFTFGICRVEY